jgi:hypothetical protein
MWPFHIRLVVRHDTRMGLCGNGWQWMWSMSLNPTVLYHVLSIRIARSFAAHNLLSHNIYNLILLKKDARRRRARSSVTT